MAQCAVKVLSAQEGLADVAKLMQAPDISGVVLKDFVGARGHGSLLTWARDFCRLGEPVKDQLCYYEGHEAQAGEPFSEQLKRQLAADFRECGEALLQDQVVEEQSEVALGSQSAAEALWEILQELMELHRSSTKSGEDLRWKVQLEVNQDGACTKYHADSVQVSLAIALAGEGLVLAQPSEVDWAFYESCEGVVPALANEDLAADSACEAIRAWNARVSKGEVTTEPGDLSIMKGGRLNPERPCLHRAPYSAEEGKEPLGLLVTVDRIPQEELQNFASMVFEEHESPESAQSDGPAHEDQEMPEASDLLPVTVLSGFLGAGKTTLLTNLLQNQEGLRIALIVNDMAEVNVDALLVKSASQVLTGKDKMIEMQNGCICCTLRGDLIDNVSKLAAEKRFDYLLIESTGISEPMPVATTFVDEHDGKDMLGKVARLDTLVTVVDAMNFSKDYDTAQLLNDRPALGAEEGDQRTIAQLLADQVECANLIVLNKVDLVKEEDVTRLELLLKKMNPKAKIIRSTYGKVDSRLLLNTRSFNLAEAEEMPGWYQELQGNHVPETEEYNISSFVFRAQRPFHPKRLDKLFSRGLDGILRSKGVLWVGGLQTSSLVLNSAGAAVSIQSGAPWLHGSEDVSDWPADCHKYKTAPYGDRRQELVLIGTDLKEPELRKSLEAALVTDEEFALGPKEWAKWPNPFRSRKRKKPSAKGAPRKKASAKKLVTARELNDEA